MGASNQKVKRDFTNVSEIEVEVEEAVETKPETIGTKIDKGISAFKQGCDKFWNKHKNTIKVLSVGALGLGAGIVVGSITSRCLAGSSDSPERLGDGEDLVSADVDILLPEGEDDEEIDGYDIEVGTVDSTSEL